MPDITMSSEQLDELLGAFQQLVQASAAPRYSFSGISSEEQTALFAYQWINGHLGRGDVVPPVLHVERRAKGRLMLDETPPMVATHARIYAEDGAVEEVALSDPLKVLDLTIADDVAIAFVEFRTDQGAPVAIVHRIPAI